VPDLPFEKGFTADKAALAGALAQIERAPDDAATIALLTRAYREPRAHVVGVTGPPGVGKSTLAGALIARLRTAQRTVAVIAVDPSSKRSGGALLGDRIRLATDPEDKGVFVRSMAARDRLGGLAEITVSAMVLMRAVYDVVLIETVGVGQSETDVAGAADTVVFCVQPGSGDSLQFMKAGIVEIPHIVVVTKSDMGAAADQARADMKSALRITDGHPAAEPDWATRVVGVSALADEGIEDLISAVDEHAGYLKAHGRLEAERTAQAAQWLMGAVRDRFGREGLKRAGDLRLSAGESPFEKLGEVSAKLSG
jgi:LAO/AO transport system kinase